MKYVFVIPANGVQVRQPGNGDVLPASGKSVEWSGYWMRRLADGDITRGEAPAKKQAPQSGETQNTAQTQRRQSGTNKKDEVK